MTEWREVVLGDLCNRVTVGHVGKMADEYVEDGVPFLRSQNVHPFAINRKGMLHISEQFHQRLAKSTLRAGDVVVVRTGYPGTAAVVPNHLDNSNCADLVVITPSGQINPYMLTAIFNSTWGRSAVGGQLVGAAQQHFNIGSAKALRIRLPGRDQQDRIAAILCALTDLIENNQQRIELLEQMARAIYREWLVDFRYPGHGDVPLVDSDLGPMPEGWELRPLFDLVKPTFGFPFKSKLFNSDGDGMPVIRIRDLLRNATETWTTEIAAPQYEVDDGDVLIGMDGDFHMCRWSGGNAYLNQRVVRLRPSTDIISRYEIFLALERPIRLLNESIVGTTVAHLGKRHLEALRLVVPSADLRGNAHEVFDCLFDISTQLRKATTDLRAIRDLLLPRLISGKIDMSKLDLERLVDPV